jgi:SpoVK/Ycf46/Vps4 family AAA+-type ATPase
MRTLFSGPNGTGKTLASEVVAAHLDVDLHSVALDAVVSKYIGETEKNLRRFLIRSRQLLANKGGL